MTEASMTETSANTPKTILLIATSADSMPNGEKTGLWLEELTTPYYAFRDAGAAVTIASIAGGPIPVDPRSLAEGGDKEPSIMRAAADADFNAAMAATPRFDTLDTDSFDAVFLAGGHGTMFDFPESTALADLVARRLTTGRILAAVCHGPAGLVAARDEYGVPLVKGRRLAAFTDSEERAVGLEDAVPFLLESRLRELGAVHVSGPDFKPFATRDGALITGQNPASAGPAAALVMDALAGRA